MPGGVFSTAKLHGMTIRESATDGSDFTNPDADYRRLFLGEDGLLHVKDSAGTVTDPYTGGGIDSGTSFPGSPSNGDLFWRTDRDHIYFYDGTRWLTTTLFKLDVFCRVPVGASGLSATSTMGNATVGEYDMWMEDMRIAAFASGTYDGTNFWTVTLDKRTTANTPTTIATATMNSQTASTWKTWTVAIDALVEIANHNSFAVIATKSASAGNLFLGWEITYRLVG